jgi:hypothetical protein
MAAAARDREGRKSRTCAPPVVSSRVVPLSSFLADTLVRNNLTVMHGDDTIRISCYIGIMGDDDDGNTLLAV